MGPFPVALCVLTCVFPGQGAPDDYYAGVATAGKQLANQMDFVFRSLATIPGPPMGRGLYKQVNRINMDLIYFRQQVERKAARSDLYMAFATVDGELNQLLDDLQDIGKWAPAVRMSARRAQTALHNVHFALATGDVSVAQQAQMAARQLQVLSNREADLESMTGIVFDNPDTLKAWNADFADLRQTIAELRRLQKNKAGAADLKRQLTMTDKSWGQLVARFKDLPKDQVLMLREDFGLVDQTIARLYLNYAIQNRRAALPTNFLP